MLSSFWTPSRQYNRPTANGKTTRRLSITSNVSLAYTPGADMRFALRCQKKSDSFSSKPEEETAAPSTTSAAEQPGFKSFTPLLPLRQRAKRLTKMQGCYPPASYHTANSEDNITQQNATKGKPEYCKVVNLCISLPTLPDAYGGRSSLLRKFTGVSWKLQEKQVQVEQEETPDLQHDLETGSSARFTRAIEQLSEYNAESS